MLEVTGQDIANLTDDDLRELVKRLASAEIRILGGSLSSVINGGDQNASDGGIDVRVELKSDLPNLDFVPRAKTGFQSKKSDMPASEITDEMRPKGSLRESIRQLADSSGAYIIVCSGGSVSDTSLSSRRKAMRRALGDIPNREQLHTDFYDRERLANWANEYVGVVAWIRHKAGRPIAGWSDVRGLTYNSYSQGMFLFDDKACVVDETRNTRLTVLETIKRLRREMRTPGSCVRLVGLSGLGKTRLVEALFEKDIGDDEPIDSGSAIYADYSEIPSPTAKQMAQELVSRGHRKVLIIDNCNPATHTKLAKICTKTKISLLTVEYDVRDDELEHTEIFRMVPSSFEVVTRWLRQTFAHIAASDCEKISQFSGANFRIARILAQTVDNGETLGRLRNQDLLKRIFQQRQEHSDQLLHQAEYLSLLYSIDGENVETNGELAVLSRVSGFAPRKFYEALVELRKRDVVQARGRFRAILPEAVANQLASNAITRIPEQDFDQFCSVLPPRMLRSVSRRLGYLHDSDSANALVDRWLQENGPLGDLLNEAHREYYLFANIAPIAPRAVLKRLVTDFKGPNSDRLLRLYNPARHQLICVIADLAYESEMFEEATMLLAPYIAQENKSHGRSAEENFGKLFQIHLSGTCASPIQRRLLIKRLAGDHKLLRCASIALNALFSTFETTYLEFIGSEDTRFGARPRHWGWTPATEQETLDWYRDAVLLAIDISTVFPESRDILARHIAILWRYESMHEFLENAAVTLAREQVWIEGWTALGQILRRYGNSMSEDDRIKLHTIIQILTPTDLLSRARATVIDDTNSFVDVDVQGHELGLSDQLKRSLEAARNIGYALIVDSEFRIPFLKELIKTPSARRSFVFGRGLAEDASNLGLIWNELVETYVTADVDDRNIEVLGGFIHEADQKDQVFTGLALDNVLNNPFLVHLLPYLQLLCDLRSSGITRLSNAISLGRLKSIDFAILANFHLSWPFELLGKILEDISFLEGGIGVVADILESHVSEQRSEEPCQDHLGFKALGYNLLLRIDFASDLKDRDHTIQKLIYRCLAGEDGRNGAAAVCKNMCVALNDLKFHSFAMEHSVNALFKLHPIIALDELFLPVSPFRRHQLFDPYSFGGSPVEKIDQIILVEWANCDPETRYPILGRCIPMFVGTLGEENKSDLSPLFFSILDKAPNKRSFLGDIWTVRPKGWSGSVVSLLRRRLEKLSTFPDQADNQVCAWINETISSLEVLIEVETKNERDREQNFE